MLKGILWSAICRNDIVLTEAGEDFYDGAVIKVAQKLLKKKATAGWEFERSRKDGLRGMKFHLYEDSDVEGSSMIVWSFVSVTESSLAEEEAKSFLEKLVYITEAMRCDDKVWRNGDLLAAQASFAPILLDKMEQVSSQGRLAMVNESISTTKEIMAENIQMALEREERLESLDQQAESLSAMTKQFKAKAQQIKRFKMWQDAKHGLLLGTAVTGVVAVITVPPLVAILA